MANDKKTGSNALVNRAAFSGALDKDLKSKLDDLHKETRIPKNRLYDEAIELLLLKYDKDISAD